MKITILGGAGVRTPILVNSIIKRQERLGITELCLMDIDQERLELMATLIDAIAQQSKPSFMIRNTHQSREALQDADFVITTFRVGDMEHRIIDEKVALENGVLGQETTGPGGFAMGMRTIPVLMKYVEQMKELCPDAWLLNFANPSGMLAEVVLKKAGWSKAVGICDGPSSMLNAAANFLDVRPDELYFDYFGLNHLGWVRSVLYKGMDLLPGFLENIDTLLEKFELPFSPDLIRSLRMIPNEYNYYYYSSKQSVTRIIRSERTRGEHISELNNKLFVDLKKTGKGDLESLMKVYIDYQLARWRSYMSIETGMTRQSEHTQIDFDQAAEQGYSGVALDIIETISQKKTARFILNVLNQGAISGFPSDAVVEIPVIIGPGYVRPLNVGEIPLHCMGLISQVKAYEQLTIDAAIEGSYAKALQALTIHPLVGDEATARKILDRYILEHGSYFPALK